MERSGPTTSHRSRAAEMLRVANAWLGGEICVVDTKGRSSFQSLQNVLSNASGTLVYFVFDLLYVDGIDLRGATLFDRKQVLGQLLESAPSAMRYSDHFDVSGSDFFCGAQKFESLVIDG
jgi:bifunctional non-homologous end joining protein LigD